MREPLETAQETPNGSQKKRLSPEAKEDGATQDPTGLKNPTLVWSEYRAH